MNRSREQAVGVIEQLYPADSDFFTTRLIGLELLERAKHEALDWRDQPVEVLQRYAELCEERELQAQRQAMRNAEHNI